MSLLKIAHLGNPILRKRAKEITQSELKLEATQKQIDDMIETMRDADGVGLAATQVHILKRIIIMEVSPDNPRYLGKPKIPLTIIINPEIISTSTETEEDWEGCLSLPDLRAQVSRHSSIKVKGLDRQGEKIELEANGFFARVIQHEIDHIDGLVFIDRLKSFSSLTYLREYQKYWATLT